MLWIHAVSIGEASAIFPVYCEFKKKFPQVRVVFSTTTKTGQQWITSKLFSQDIAIYYPLDFYFSVRRVLRQIRPAAYLVVETEIWPNFWWEAHRLQIPLALMNGRLSKRSFKRYEPIRWFMKPILNLLSVVTVQAQQDAERFLRLGAAPQKLFVSGNLKFESFFDFKSMDREVSELRHSFSILPGEMILMGGSTHEGEEKILLNVFGVLKKEIPKLRLILAPRHPERFKEVSQLIQEQDLMPILDSSPVKSPWTNQHVYLVDQMGRLPTFYALATVVFIGKSLTAIGGQNLLEPAILGKIILFGPHMENFESIAQNFLKEEAAIQVSDEADMLNTLRCLRASSDMQEKMKKNAQQIIHSNKGALAMVLSHIERQAPWRP